jgi:hypothetical protein
VLLHKAALEQHLKDRLGRLFAVCYDLPLYDVTSVYFEGEAIRNPQAQRGYSRDHRPDCKQVNLALIVTREALLESAASAMSGRAESRCTRPSSLLRWIRHR